MGEEEGLRKAAQELLEQASHHIRVLLCFKIWVVSFRRGKKPGSQKRGMQWKKRERKKPLLNWSFSSLMRSRLPPNLKIPSSVRRSAQQETRAQQWAMKVEVNNQRRQPKFGSHVLPTFRNSTALNTNTGIPRSSSNAAEFCESPWRLIPNTRRSCLP